MNLERGFRRLTWIVSFLLAIPWIVLWVMDYYSHSEFWLTLAGASFLSPWIVFFLGRWVAQGFKSNSDEDYWHH